MLNVRKGKTVVQCTYLCKKYDFDNCFGLLLSQNRPVVIMFSNLSANTETPICKIVQKGEIDI